jgi:hypothetical protein
VGAHSLLQPRMLTAAMTVGITPFSRRAEERQRKVSSTIFQNANAITTASTVVITSPTSHRYCMSPPPDILVRILVHEESDRRPQDIVCELTVPVCLLEGSDHSTSSHAESQLAQRSASPECGPEALTFIGPAQVQ